MDFLPRRDFYDCVDRNGGQRRIRGIWYRDPFLGPNFARLMFRQSLRAIETCLRALAPKLDHAGFRGQIARSALADANRAHSRIFADDFAAVLIRRVRALYASEPLRDTPRQ